uniref:Uncharacterized protein n=1 Tax=Oryza nivara TaxID=4536 RepID=A0A0E0HN76_ORYNI
MELQQLGSQLGAAAIGVGRRCCDPDAPPLVRCRYARAPSGVGNQGREAAREKIEWEGEVRVSLFPFADMGYWANGPTSRGEDGGGMGWC